MTAVVGIDPGAKGSICFLDSVTKEILFADTPQGYGDAQRILKALVTIHLKNPIQMIGIEDVHSIYGMSAKSNFSFGFNVGQVHTIAEMTDIGIDLVQPKIWQAGCGIRFKPKMKSADRKRIVADTAIRLYPSADIFGPKGGLLDGRADSLMIAHYLLIKYGNTT